MTNASASVICCPAAKAGIRGGNRTVRFNYVDVPIAGDIIIAANETPATALQGLTVYLENKTQVGQTGLLAVRRAGQKQMIPVVLGGRPQQQ